MIVLSFRVKLLLTMMLLIAGVTGATLSVTQKKVRGAYQRIHQDQFETEVNFFLKQHDARLGGIRDGCVQLANSPELRDALAHGQIAHAYEVATNELNVPSLRPNRPAARGNAGGGGLRPAVFLRLLNTNGTILRVVGQRLTPFQQQTSRRLEQQLATVRQALDQLGAPLVGFLPRNLGNGHRDVLDEVVVTRIIDAASQKSLGAIVLGQPFFDLSGTNMFQMSGIQSGIWVDNQLHSETIPENLHEEFSRLVAGRLSTNSPAQGSFPIALGGVQQRLCYKLLNPESYFPAAYQVSLYSMAAALRTEAELRRQLLVFAVLALFAGLLLSLLVAHSLSVPLRELVAGTEAVRGGDFFHKVPVRSRDEVGQLATSFNEMAEGLAQKERYRTVLNMVTDEKVARELMKGQLALGGELREVTVLFCDIRGFTPLTQGMPPEEVIEMLNVHMTALKRVVKEHNGVLDKFVGDLLMAIFGAPVSTGEDALDAARCSLVLIQKREELNETARHKLKIGIGIATGTVVAGCMGSADHLNYTVLGERVNLASRLCGQAGPGQVIIDQATRDKLAEKITTEPLPSLNLKGFSENVVAYQLTGVLSWGEPVLEA
jgi:class 3 adenylate cyclase